MKIGEKEYSEILVTDSEDNLLASITDKDIIEEQNCKVVCISSRKNYPDKEQWRRFEVITDNDQELAKMEELLDRKKINRQELALILFCLRVRPEFSREDFGI